MVDSAQQLIEDEVQRRLSSQVIPLQEEIAELRQMTEEQSEKLLQQHAALQRMNGEALTFATLMKVHNFPDPIFFQVGDEVIVIDDSSPHYQKIGSIINTQESDPSIAANELDDPQSVNGVVSAEGFIAVRLSCGSIEEFSIGLEGKGDAKVRLVSGNDGTYAVINEGGTPWEVKGIPDLNLQAGFPVKILPKTKAIVGPADHINTGPVCRVQAITDAGIEVTHRGELYLVRNPRNLDFEEGDRVSCDTGMITIQEKLAPDPRQKYKIRSELNVTWDDIGGLEEAKKELRDSLELPISHPELFKYYNVKPLNGFLLYGPPGCGKTLFVRVCAWAMSQLYSKDVCDSAYRYVKSPEILDKYIGNTEAEIRALFQNGRRHFWNHGYKQCLVFDEAEAILPKRGTRRSSDIADTMVPMFLGEMDGVDSKDTEANPVIFLLSNRSDIIDPAITRPGRISKHIKIGRPTITTAMDVLKIHTTGLPFQDKEKEILSLTVADIFSKRRLLYRVNNTYDFTLGDCINGAMLANVAEIAKMRALNRDIRSNNKGSGLIIDDFKAAVEKSQQQIAGVNHDFDLEDFAEKHGIDKQSMTAERIQGASG